MLGPLVDLNNYYDSYQYFWSSRELGKSQKFQSAYGTKEFWGPVAIAI